MELTSFVTDDLMLKCVHSSLYACYYKTDFSMSMSSMPRLAFCRFIEGRKKKINTNANSVRKELRSIKKLV